MNLLCLDEPTNHLDIASRDVLEDALQEFDGAMLLITHDRHLIRSVADTIVEVVDGRARVFDGDYEDYLARKEADDAAPATGPTNKGGDKDRKRAEAVERQRRSRAQAELRTIETDLERAHARLAILGAQLADPEFYGAGEGVSAAVHEYGETQQRIAELEQNWERVADELA